MMVPRNWAKFVLVVFIAVFSVSASIASAASVSVRGYYRKDGTYVRPHTRTAPDGNPYNNYSFPGNYNPNTGKVSTGDPEKYLERYYNRAGASSALPSQPNIRGSATTNVNHVGIPIERPTTPINRNHKPSDNEALADLFK